MQVERIDHVHIKYGNLKSGTEGFEKITGAEFMKGLDFTEIYGMEASFLPFPNALELMMVTDKNKEMASIYNAQPDGVFALSYKVHLLDTAIPEMESMGYNLLLRYEFGEIKEALFDTKKELGVFIELIEYSGLDIVAVDHGNI